MPRAIRLIRRLAVTAGLSGALVFPLTACAQQTGDKPTPSAGGKPLLSQAIKATLERDGPEAAKRRFDEILKDRDNYQLDADRMSALGADYLQRGDIAWGTVVMEMTMTLYQEITGAIQAGLPPPPPPPPGPARRPAPRAEAPVDLGPARTDLDRFLGVYGDPPQPGVIERNVFVRIGCSPGHLDVGAMWGDVAPWTLKSLKDTEFVQGYVNPEDPSPPVRVIFHLGPDGRAVGLSHSLLSPRGALTRVLRLGDLPTDWPPPFCERGR